MLNASTTVARTQPEVVVPTTTTLSAPSKVRYAARFEPKKPDGFCFLITMSLGPGAIGATISLPSRLLPGPPPISALRLDFQPQLPRAHLSARPSPVV